MNDAAFPQYEIEFELTGYAEHLRDEAYECGELAAMRREANREAEREAWYAEEADRVAREEFEAQQANPFTSVCPFDSWNAPECQPHRADDEIPF